MYNYLYVLHFLCIKNKYIIFQINVVLLMFIKTIITVSTKIKY